MPFGTAVFGEHMAFRLTPENDDLQIREQGLEITRTQLASFLAHVVGHGRSCLSIVVERSFISFQIWYCSLRNDQESAKVVGEVNICHSLANHAQPLTR